MGVFEARETLHGAGSRAGCGCAFLTAGSTSDPTLDCSPLPRSPSSHRPTHAALWDPASPARLGPHLMLMKLPEDMCACSARISSSFTPAARLRGLEWAGGRREKAGTLLATFLKQATPPPFFLTAGFLLSAFFGQVSPTPGGWKASPGWSPYFWSVTM